MLSFSALVTLPLMPNDENSKPLLDIVCLAMRCENKMIYIIASNNVWCMVVTVYFSDTMTDDANAAGRMRPQARKLKWTIEAPKAYPPIFRPVE